MSERETFIKNAAAYLVVGDLDKDFHLPECECKHCETWRLEKDRPTRAELRALAAPTPEGE